jgi:hypothetical protein
MIAEFGKRLFSAALAINNCAAAQNYVTGKLPKVRVVPLAKIT